MDLSEASVVSARGGEPTPDGVPDRRSVSGVALVLILVPGILLAVLGRPAVAASARNSDAVTLAAQSPAWLGPDPAHQVLTLSLHVASSAPRSALGVQLTLYRRVPTRSQFTEMTSGRGLGTSLARSPTLAVKSLAADAHGDLRVTIPVMGDVAPAAAGDWTAPLGCRSGCAGVYPLKVTLVDSASPAIGPSFVTFLIYDNPSAGSHPVRVALVVPLGLPAANLAGGPAGGAVGRATAVAVARLESLAGTLSDAPQLPLTVVPDPSSLVALEAEGHAHAAGVVAGAAAPSARQTLSQSFAPVNATSLVDSGLGNELAAQIVRAGQVLSAASPDVHGTKSTWVSESLLDNATLGALSADFAHAVVPPGTVTGPVGNYTATQPFTLAGTTAAMSDAPLGSHLVTGAAAPALAAVQFLADASLVYDEQPNLSAPRGVIAVAPTAWSPDTALVSALVEGLLSNPVLAPVTLDQYFQQIPVGADRRQATVRRPSSGTGSPTLPARAIRAARTNLQAFASAVAQTPAGTAVAQNLDDMLLGAESSELTSRQQQAQVGAVDTALDGQLHQLSIRSDTVRLTSGAASVPLTFQRTTRYAVTAVVQVTSDKLTFPAPSTQTPDGGCRAPVVHSSAGRSSYSALCVLAHTTTAVYVDMRSRTAGDFRIDVTLASPRGGLVLASGHLTVRSMSTSAVAIALSAAAAAVLLAWWGRTLLKNRGRRRGAHVAGAKTATRPPARAATP